MPPVAIMPHLMTNGPDAMLTQSSKLGFQYRSKSYLSFGVFKVNKTYIEI